IGQEVLLYDKNAGVVVRGARGTTAVDHPSQVTVSLYGYSSKVRTGAINVDLGGLSVSMPYDRIPRTNATTPYGFGAAPAATVCGDKQDPVTMVWQIVNTATQIGVVTPNIMDFP